MSLFGNIDTYGEKSFLSTSGIGVGLSSSYKISRGLGGFMNVTSALKLGTSVEFSFTAYPKNVDQVVESNPDLSDDDDGEAIISNLNVFGQ